VLSTIHTGYPDSSILVVSSTQTIIGGFKGYPVFSKVLIPLDGSPNVDSVINWGEMMAESFTSELILLRVLERSQPSLAMRKWSGGNHFGQNSRADDVLDDPMAEGGESEKLPTLTTDSSPVRQEALRDPKSDVIDQLVQGAETYLDDIASRIKRNRFNVRKIVTKGIPAQEIDRVARLEGADLIVLMASTEFGEKSSTHDIVTHSVLRATKIPVLVLHSIDLRNPGLSSPSVVLVPLDGSKISESAIPYATNFASKFDSKIVFVRVTNPTFSGLSGSTEKSKSGSMSSLRIRDLAKEYLGGFVDTARKSGISSSFRTPMGTASEAILAVADESADALIVICTHGIGRINRRVIGSVTSMLIRSAAHPVLVVPPPSIN
jgi:nucleotide-binding universal stress UspA family protein